MKLDVISIDGKANGNVDLPESVFGVEPNEHAVYLAVKQYNAAQRQGTHKAKEKGEITASTRKIKKQKGTGTARAGSLKSPVFRGGGRIFGPRPRKYNIKLNKKVKTLAKTSALSHKFSTGAVKVVSDINFGEIKTKNFVQLMDSLEVTDKKCLFVLEDYNDVVYKSSRNIKKANVVTIKDLNTYDVLNSNVVVFTSGAIDKIEEVFA